MPRAYINIGSNIGDRRANIARAVTAVSALPVTGIIVSPLFTSEPWGYSSPNDYLNQGISFVTELPPARLLDLLLAIERTISDASHRTPDGSYADRIIDIDLIAIDGVCLNSPSLTLPHPRASRRPFVMLPLINSLHII